MKRRNSARSRVGSQSSPVRRGLVLILVLVVVMGLALCAYSFTDLMMTYNEATVLAGRQTQARMLVDSGVEMTRLFLSQNEAARREAGGEYENPERFRVVAVMPEADQQDRCSLAVLAPKLDDSGNYGGVRFGLEDESTRLNLNTLLMTEQQSEGAAAGLLMALPGMTEETADAILDWLDADEEPRPLGAEGDHYSGLSPAYACKNGPLETVEELLLVRGVTPRLLFGADSNRNGTIDQHEAAAAGAETVEGGERGWSAYLTLYSLENNLRPDGQPRIFLNQTNLQTLHDQLSEVLPPEWVTFIIAYRQGGPYAGATAPQSGASGALDLTKSAKTTISQVLDLIDAKTQITFTGASQATILASPFKSDIGSMNSYMAPLMDNVAINPAPTIPGRININQAPRVILEGIPGMTPEAVEQIMTRRDPEAAADNPGRMSEMWLLSEGVVTLQEMRLLLPFITGGGDVFRAQVVGYYQTGQAASRAEVVFDATRLPARVLFWRDISHLGRGYALETLGVEYTETPAAE